MPFKKHINVMRVLKTFASLLLLASCSQAPESLSDGSLEIKLNGDIGTAVTSTTRGVVNKDHASALDVAFARIDQQTGGAYPAYTTVTKALEATRAGGTGITGITFNESQYYQSSLTNNKTKLIGWYPVGTLANGVITIDISNGTTDAMLTNEVEGDKMNTFGGLNRTFTFKHLLTQVSVKAFADDQVETVWGEIKSVKVKSQAPNCVVTLPTQTPTWSGAPVDVALKNITNDAAMSNVSLVGKTTSGSAVACGYAMFPPTTGKSLSLSVETTKGGSYDVSVNLPASANPQFFGAGRAYTITLEFQSSAFTIAAKADIAGWITDNSEINGKLP